LSRTHNGAQNGNIVANEAFAMQATDEKRHFVKLTTERRHLIATWRSKISPKSHQEAESRQAAWRL